jgi:hypothetical protein
MATLRRVCASALTAVFLLAVPANGAQGQTPPTRHEPSATAAASTSTSTSTSAGKAYTYWGYYNWNDAKSTWDYMKVGANDRTDLPQDGEVYGFRWALVVKDPRLPRAEGDFEAICGSTPAAEGGKKRIALVVDYGTTSDAVGDDETPEAEGLCASVDESFTVQQALQSVTAVRTGDSGFICGISGYPSEGCGAAVNNAEEPPADQAVTLRLPGDDASGSGTPNNASSDSTDDGSNVSVPVIVAIAVILILVVGALVIRRRQS